MGAATSVESVAPRSYTIPVRTYRLKFFEDAQGVAKHVEFEAQDAAQALVIAHREAAHRSAELWCNGRKVCTIKREMQAF